MYNFLLNIHKYILKFKEINYLIKGSKLGQVRTGAANRYKRTR